MLLEKMETHGDKRWEPPEVKSIVKTKKKNLPQNHKFIYFRAVPIRYWIGPISAKKNEYRIILDVI